MISGVFCLLAVALLLASAQNLDATFEKKFSGEEVEGFWRAKSRATLEQKLKQQLNLGTAKNVIFFLGDGMGISSVTGGRIWSGQQKGVAGEESLLSLEQLPYTGLSKTYSVDMMTPDSAATGTAYLCGVKTNNGVLGLTGSVKRGDCEASLDEANQVKSIFSWAHEAGKWIGFVTTDVVVGASPAAGYAQSANRDWYSSVPPNCSAKDIAQQMLFGEVGKQMRVMLGGGSRYFLPETPITESKRMFPGDDLTINQPGARHDNRNLIEEYLEVQQQAGLKAKFISTRAELKDLDLSQIDRLLGLFNREMMSFVLDLKNETLPDVEPTLSEMTEVAINMLSKGPNGFVLFVEGGNIDWAHHLSKAWHALEEVVQFDNAIATAKEMLSNEDTLTLVTADHSHGFTVNGYGPRGRSIPGFTDSMNDANKTYRIMSYATGPGTPYPSLEHMKFGVHSAEEVPIYASGPWAHLLVGSIEESFIAEAIAYSACIGPYQGTMCNRTPDVGLPPTTGIPSTPS